MPLGSLMAVSEMKQSGWNQSGLIDFAGFRVREEHWAGKKEGINQILAYIV